MIDLLPCPFCGGKARHSEGLNEHWISCMSCQSSSLMRGNIEATVSAWNARPGPAQSRDPDPITLDSVAEAIRLASCERGYPVHPNVVRHLAIAALLASPGPSNAQGPSLREAFSSRSEAPVAWRMRDANGYCTSWFDGKPPNLHGPYECAYAAPSSDVSVREALEPEFDPTNHHNALKCPYCNPDGLAFAPKSPALDPATVELALASGASNADTSTVRADEDPVLEVWNGDRKVTVYEKEVMRIWGPDMEDQMCSDMRDHETVAAAFDWLYAEGPVPQTHTAHKPAGCDPCSWPDCGCQGSLHDRGQP